jgi:HEAT repeat protein
LRRAAAAAVAADPADDEWLDALVAAFGLRADADSVVLVEARLTAPRPASVAGAARALARIGDPAALTRLEALWPNRDKSVHEAVVDALLTLVTRAPDKAAAAETVQRWLDTGLAPHHRCAALRALAQIDAVGAVPRLTADLGHADAAVRAAAADTLATLGSPGVSEALRAALTQAAPPGQLALIAVLARRAAASRDGDKLAGVLVKLLDSPDPAVRRAAAHALGQCGDATAAQALLAHAAGAADEAQSELVAAALTIGGRLAGTDPAAGQTLLLAGYAAAKRDAERSSALHLLLPVATLDSLSVLRPLLEQGDLKAAAGRVALRLMAQLTAKGRREEAVALGRSLVRGGVPELATPAAARLAGLGVIIEPARAAGFLTRWWLLGPLPNPAQTAADREWPPERGVDPKATVQIEGHDFQWQFMPTADPGGAQNLLPLWQPNVEVCAYAYTEFTMPAAQDALLKIGSDDGVVVWLNGDRVWRNIVERPLIIDQDTVRVHLRVGPNRLLLKVLQAQGEWGYSARLARPDGSPLTCEPMAPPK